MSVRVDGRLDYFIEHEDGFLCGECNAAGPKVDVDDEDVQVWRYYSDGFSEPCVCSACFLSVPVYVDAEADEVDTIEREKRAIKREKALRPVKKR